MGRCGACLRLDYLEGFSAYPGLRNAATRPLKTPRTVARVSRCLLPPSAHHSRATTLPRHQPGSQWPGRHTSKSVRPHALGGVHDAFLPSCNPHDVEDSLVGNPDVGQVHARPGFVGGSSSERAAAVWTGWCRDGYLESRDTDSLSTRATALGGEGRERPYPERDGPERARSVVRGGGGVGRGGERGGCGGGGRLGVGRVGEGRCGWDRGIGSLGGE